MDPNSVFCPNPDCPACGQTGQGNIGVHSCKERRYICHVCQKTFAETKGTAFYRLHHAKDLFVLVITLLAYGCPLQAIVVAFGLDERTVQAWQKRAGRQSERVQQHLVEKPRDLGQVQSDELRVKTQRGVVWLAMAMQVSTRLWLGGVCGLERSGVLVRNLLAKVKAAARCAMLLLCTDGWAAYPTEARRIFREPERTGRLGRPRLRPWPHLLIGQVIKQYAQRRVVGVIRRVVQGSEAAVQAMIGQTQGGGRINTAYIERLNATFRERLASLVRRGRALVRHSATLYAGMYLVGAVYNFCTNHDSLRRPGGAEGPRWQLRTPAMAAGITDHRWSVAELLWYRVPPPPWRPPKRRGRRSIALKRLIERWCPNSTV